MRVMINCLAPQGPETGGGYTFLAGLLDQLSREDTTNEYFLITSSSNRRHFEFALENFRTITLPAVAVSPALRVAVENLVLPMLAARYRVDVFFSPNDALPPALACATVVGALNVLHYYSPELMMWSGVQRRESLKMRLQRTYYRQRTPNAMRRAHRVVAISQETRRQVLENVSGVGQDRVKVIYPGVPRWISEAPARQSSIVEEESSPFFLSTSAILPYKNFDKLIEAFATFVRTQSAPHRLVIVGREVYPSYQRELERLADRLGVRDRVTFPGFVDRDRLIWLYSHATAFLLLSSCESFGFPIVEAMACGAPVVVSHSSTLPEVATGAGIVVDPRDSSHLAEVMNRLATEPTFRQGLSERSISRAAEFRWDCAASAFVSVLAEAIAQQSNGVAA